MKKTTTLIGAAVIAIALTACNAGSNTAKKPAESEQSGIMSASPVSFKTAENYFVKNTVTATIPSKITTQEEFDKYFGMATTMGDNGKPTPIDFTKEYVIVVDHESTSKKTDLMPVSLTKKDADITLTYSMKHGDDNGFATHPFLMVIVDKSNDGNVTLQMQ